MLQDCNKQAVHQESGTIFSPGFHISRGSGGKCVDRGKRQCIDSIIICTEY